MWSVYLVTRVGACLCALLASVPWVGMGPGAEAHIGVLSGRCPPPRADAGGRVMGPLCRGFGSDPGVGPPLHTLHTLVAGPAGWGRLGEGAPGVTCVLCPCLTHSADLGKTGGGYPFSPISQWNPGLFFSSFGKAVLSGHSTSFLQTEIAILAVSAIGRRH